ncbi:hypothetical protein GCM10023195_79250 [Actinoallomurus liliacearum]|uniref:Uncharacterized protein n=1 Tax=Actinoallomurus liliacearum TaxID=1080073 RepID=A0ABP8TZ11_9ACTN
MVLTTKKAPSAATPPWAGCPVTVPINSGTAMPMEATTPYIGDARPSDSAYVSRSQASDDRKTRPFVRNLPE